MADVDNSNEDSQEENLQDQSNESSSDEKQQQSSAKSGQNGNDIRLLIYSITYGFFMALIAIFIGIFLTNYDFQSKTCLKDGKRILTSEQLKLFVKKPKILLAFVGEVYDVTSGHVHYSQEENGPYSFFSGRDATRAFLTGIFNDPNELRDDILDLDVDYLEELEKWQQFYRDKYPLVGVVVGTYYDENGCQTEQLKRLHSRLEMVKQIKHLRQDNMEHFPPCNSMYDAQIKSGRVWCTQQSGGIDRNWIGYPRLYFDNDIKQWRCACVKSDEGLEFCNDEDDGVQYDENPAASPTPTVSPLQYRKNDDKGPKYTAINPSTSSGYSKNNCRFKYYENCPNRYSRECPIY